MTDKKYWNVTVPEPSGIPIIESDSETVLEEPKHITSVDASLGVTLMRWPEDGKGQIQVFGEVRTIPIEQLSESPRFEHQVDATFLDGMSDVSDMLDELGAFDDE